MRRVRAITFGAAAGVNPRVRTRARARVHTRGYAATTDAPRPTDPAVAFARIVEEQVSGPVLPYAKRMVLLALAARRGLGRFEANLIIALVQHRRGQIVSVMRADKRAPRRARRVPAVAVAGAMQCAILVYGWWVLG